MTPVRQLHRQRVDELLDELERKRHRVAVLEAGGARPTGLRDLTVELDGVRQELAVAVAAAGS